VVAGAEDGAHSDGVGSAVGLAGGDALGIPVGVGTGGRQAPAGASAQGSTGLGVGAGRSTHAQEGLVLTWPEALRLGVGLCPAARIPVGEGAGVAADGWPGAAVDADGWATAGSTLDGGSVWLISAPTPPTTAK
jgi:hypothetical protein